MSTNQFPVTIQLYHDADTQQLHVHTVTVTDSSDYVNNGHKPFPSSLNAQGELELDLLIGRDPNQPNLPFSTPVVHNLAVNLTPYNITGSIIARVNVYDDDDIMNSNKVGDSVGTSLPADETTRPIL